MSERTCTADRCEKPYLAKGLCAMHYRRLAVTGSLEPRPRPTAEQRFYAKVIEAGECWKWVGSTDTNGYGKFNPGGNKPVTAHRWSYEFMVGWIPYGLHLDHLCRNRWCVNPSHLDPVTPAENVRRGRLHHRCKACCPIETKRRRKQRILIEQLSAEIRRLERELAGAL